MPIPKIPKKEYEFLLKYKRLNKYKTPYKNYENYDSTRKV
jgi:hypothetical protein